MPFRTRVLGRPRRIRMAVVEVGDSGGDEIRRQVSVKKHFKTGLQWFEVAIEHLSSRSGEWNDVDRWVHQNLRTINSCDAFVFLYNNASDMTAGGIKRLIEAVMDNRESRCFPFVVADVTMPANAKPRVPASFGIGLAIEHGGSFGHYDLNEPEQAQLTVVDALMEFQCQQKLESKIRRETLNTRYKEQPNFAFYAANGIIVLMIALIAWKIWWSLGGSPLDLGSNSKDEVLDLTQ